MSARKRAAGPTWRPPTRPADLEPDHVFVACRCGTDMSFVWPLGRLDVRCFACGARFDRPGHLPASPPSPPWRPAPRRPTWTRSVVALLLLVAVTAGLLGAALALAIRG